MPKAQLATLKDLQKNLSLTLAEATHSTTPPQMRQWKKDVIALGDQQFITDPTKETTGPFGSRSPAVCCATESSTPSS